ncbi:hypothetical protein J7E93_06620 [Streptomyces sp. ISL-36]|uniref:hypothetical protein n=1 Tax=Streptomyces sp. ISL-36 TaxID=2819182 RepID=UPI001BE97927|nr:hypothetical protein [Streptomyces sp. ISL-36]MBT2439799.1 hypothetical protein [Streptomyces sp. ISL-36]
MFVRFRSTPKARPALFATPDELASYTAGLRVLADDLDAGHPLALGMVEDGDFFTQSIVRYPTDPLRDELRTSSAGQGSSTSAEPSWLADIRDQSHNDNVARLLTHVKELQQRLERAEAAFPGITHLAADEPADLTIYRAEDDRAGLPLGLYTSREAARNHASDMAGRDGERTGWIEAWIPDSGDTEAIEELVLFHPASDDEHPTQYTVVPVPLSPAYDPEAEE